MRHQQVQSLYEGPRLIASFGASVAPWSTPHKP